VNDTLWHKSPATCTPDMHILLSCYCLLPPHPVSTSSNQSCCLLPPQPVFTSSNQSCSTEQEGEREECATHPNYFLSAKSTPWVHESLLVPCKKNFTLPDGRLQLVELTSTSAWAPESKPEHTSHWAEHQPANQRTHRNHCSAHKNTTAHRILFTRGSRGILHRAL
jgi:hypothetical protein